MSFGKSKRERERVELRERKEYAAKSMHPKASFGTQIEEKIQQRICSLGLLGAVITFNLQPLGL